MKLLTIILIIILFISIIFGSKTYREGARTQRNSPKGEYGSVIVIQKQIQILDEVKYKVKRIPSYEIDPKTRSDINTNLDMVRNGIQSWLTNRINYLNLNNKTPFPPSENESIDGLRKLWNDNGIGYKILIDGITERLNLAEDTQGDIARLLRIFVNNMNIELNISLADTKIEKTDDDAELLGDMISNNAGYSENISDIFTAFDTTEKTELTYEERYS